MQRSDLELWTCLGEDARRYRTLVKGRPGPHSTWALAATLVSPRFAPVLVCRLAFSLGRHGLTPLAKALSALNLLIFGIEVATHCQIKGGLLLPHTQGTVIGAFSIGRNATIFQGVTLGAKELEISFSEATRPSIGDGVVIGAGAKVLGGIQVGSNVKIGANAVVIRPVPDNTLAVGVPAIHSALK